MEPVNDMRVETRSQKIIEFLSLGESRDRLLAFEVPKDALTWTRFCGSLLLVLIILLFFSGIFMAFYYSPVPGTAYDSVDFALFKIPFGSVVKGIHHYSWNLLLMVMGIHLGRSLILGSYKAPRQMVWVTGENNFVFCAAVYHYRRSFTLGPDRLLVNPGPAEYHLFGSFYR